MIFGKSNLEKKLDLWMTEGGDLYEVLGSEMNKQVSSRADAKAICRALDVVREKGNSDSKFASTLHYLTGFFQQADGKAMEVFGTKGLPRLRVWVHDLLAGEDVDKDSALFIVKILAMYRQREDLDLIARVARLPAVSDGFTWSLIFNQFDGDHPYSNKMIDLLRDPLPGGFVSVSYLDMANALAIAGKLDRHPFDSNAGCIELERFLRDQSEDNFSYAISATAAIPFVDSPEHRERLLSAAFDHPDPLVRIEAAWAQAKCGADDGFRRLGQLCLDHRFSYTAQIYLNELGRTDLIPEDAKDEEFRAIAEMANWLAHPSELGQPPDSVELFDARELFWPPTNDRRQLFLVKYSTGAEVGVGMVGSVTFALFGEATADMSAEEIYSVHCCWELEMNGDPRAPDERNVEAGKEILAKYNSGFRFGTELEKPE